MNTRPPLENPSSTVALYLAFNEDASCFTVGTNTGFCSMIPSLYLEAKYTCFKSDDV